ncbi:MAG: hypothetical protein RI967_571 [Planctomycetota bacterium]
MQGRSLFWIIVGVFAVSAVAVSVFSWSVIGGIESRARATDARLREVAWGVLAYADEFAAFPLAESEFRAFLARPEGVPAAIAADPAGAYPATRADAGLATDAPPLGAQFDACLTELEIEWPLARDVQPIVRTRGLATLQGTLPAVGDWLWAMATRVRESGAGEG